jgi:beta-lactamase regulating signal transducer with metallopeptidase domain/Tol biopolymer transport system component
MESVIAQIQPFFEWLLQTTLQASLLICLIFVLQAILRTRLGIRWYYGLWLLLLVRMALPWAPQSRVSLFNIVPRSLPQKYARSVSVQPHVENVASEPTVSSTSGSTPAKRSKTVREEPKTITPTAPASPIAEAPSSKAGPFELADALPWIWLAGAIGLAVYVCTSNLRLLRIVKRRRQVTDQGILDLLEDCKAQMGIRTILGVVSTYKIKSPALFGFVRPRLLLPAGMIETLSYEELRYVFLHELAHLKRRDIYIGWLMSVLQVLHWFNPLVWFAFRRMRSDRELACDALVLARMQNDEPKSYGRIIVDLLERFSCPRPMPGMAGIMENKSQLKRRITMIAKFKKNSYRWSPMPVALIIILACISLPNAINLRASQTSGTNSETGMVLRRVWAGSDVDHHITASPKGRYLSYVDSKTGDLAVREIGSGKTRHLTSKGDLGAALYSVISPDSNLVAYSWFTNRGKSSLCLVGIDGSADRRLCASKDHNVFPVCWSSDSKHILAKKHKMGNLEIILVSVENGSVEVVREFGNPPFWDRLCYSPKDRFIVYDFARENSSNNYDIGLYDTEDNSETSLIEHPANDRLLGWIPNTQEILFLSDRSGSQDIWSVKILDGKTKGSPRLVTRDIGQIVPQGLTQDGSLYFSRYTRKFTTYIVPFDKTGKTKAESRTAILGSSCYPEWSPDGEYLAYVKEKDDKRRLHIRNLKTDEERELAENLEVRSPCWSPDGRFILVPGFDCNQIRKRDYRGGIYVIDIQENQATPLVSFSPDRTIGWGRSIAEWSTDGKSIFYLAPNGIVRREIKSGKEKQLYESSSMPSAFCLSPDGERLAFCMEEKGQVLSIPVLGGQPDKLVSFEETKKGFKVPRQLAWSPDGNYILFAKKEKEGSAILRVACGSARTMTILRSSDVVHSLDVNPYGEDIAYCTYVQDGAVWVMENFLPEATVAKSEPKPMLRQIEVRGRGTRHSSPSFDGKYMSDVNRETGNLVIRNIATGKQWNLTNKDSNSGDFADSSAISPDSTKVIYYWFNAEKEDFDLRVVGLDGSGDRLLWGAREGARSFNMDTWSSDGKYVYGEYLEDKPVRLVRVSVADGSGEVIKTFEKKRFFTVSCSPDGRYIAYDCAENKSSSRDVYVYDLEKKTEEPLIRHTANDKLLGWTPNGRNVFFSSDRNGTWDGWLLRVIDGQAVGLPEVIQAGMGDVSPIRFTQSGAFYYAYNHEAWNVYTTKLDVDTDEAASQVKPVRHLGKDTWPDWSPDGRYLAYLSQPDSNKPQIIRIRTLATGQERELRTDLPFFRFLHWCPDSRHLLIADFKDRSAVYRLDIQSGEYTELVRSIQSEGQKIKQAELSADGKTLVYRIRGRGTVNRLMVKDMQTGDEKELLQTEGSTVLAFAAGWALSTDGKKIAFSIREGTDSPYVLKIISVETGNIKDTGINDVWQITWADDGDHFVFTKTKNLKELWTVPIEQGEPEKIMEWNEMLLCPTIHPDGHRIAFFSGGYVSEMWVMKNFLPSAVAAAGK